MISPSETYAGLVVVQIQSLGEEAAKSIVHNWIGTAEDLYLDFKRKADRASAHPADDDRRLLAKALSGFANSDGGLLVWGVDARKNPSKLDSPDVAFQVEPIWGVAGFHAELNTLIHSATKPVVPNVLNYRIYEDRSRVLGYVVTHVPTGDHPPYRALFGNDNNFYKRAGSSFYAMEPYDLRDVVFRQNYPKMEVRLQRGNFDLAPNRHVYSLSILLRNQGPVTLTAFKLELLIPKSIFVSVKGTPSTPVTIEGISYEQIVFSRPHGLNVFRLFPDDELTLFEPRSEDQILYMMDTRMHSEGIVLGQSMKFWLYGEHMPAVVGSVRVKDLILF